MQQTNAATITLNLSGIVDNDALAELTGLALAAVQAAVPEGVAVESVRVVNVADLDLLTP